MWGFGDGDGGDGLHGLNRHGEAEEKTGGDVVEGGEDKSGGEVETGDESESEDDGDEGAEVADSSRYLGGDSGEVAETAVKPAGPPEKRSCGGGFIG